MQRPVHEQGDTSAKPSESQRRCKPAVGEPRGKVLRVCGEPHAPWIVGEYAPWACQLHQTLLLCRYMSAMTLGPGSSRPGSRSSRQRKVDAHEDQQRPPPQPVCVSSTRGVVAGAEGWCSNQGPVGWSTLLAVTTRKGGR